MSSIQTGIQLNDQFTEVIYGIINAVNMAVSSMEDMQQTMDNNVDVSGIQAIRDELNQATVAADELNAAIQSQGVINTNPTAEPQTPQPVEMPYIPEGPRSPPDPVEIPVTWSTDNLDVFYGTGIERFQQEIQSTNDMLATLNQTQQQIEETASGIDILPNAAVQDVSTLGQRLQMIQQRIQQIENNPVNIGTDTANAELEQMRAQLNLAVQEQNKLNNAVQNMDVSAVNGSYLRLSQIIGNAERYIRDNVDEQGRFNQEVQKGVQQADGLMRSIQRVAAAYVSFQTVGRVIELSDTMTQTTARLNLIVDDGGSVEELQNKIYASAQNARGSYLATADAVSKLGMQASQAFNSNDELIAFTELLNKSFVNAGTSAQGIDSVMLQLTQAMAAGKLQGEELNAVLDNAAPIVQHIQQYLEEVQGIDADNIKQLASEGVLTADVIKNAMFYASDEINAKFESMPMTWSQISQSMQNTTLMAFQPVLQRLNDIANSESFQTFVSGAVQAMAILANIILNIFDLIGTVGGFIADNWSIISPIIYGVVAALGAYLAVSAIVATINGIHAASEATKAAAQMMATGATFAETAAQHGLNAALMACPIVWIIVLIIALVAAIIMLCNWIAEATGAANSGIGVICGGINVVRQFLWNLLLTAINVVFGIQNAVSAITSNIKTAFYNAIYSVQARWYALLSTVLTVVASICEALNKLPFIEFDYSGITSAAEDYAAKSAEAIGKKEDYQSIGDAFNEGFNTFDTFQDGWASDAFNAGAAWGDGIAEAIDNFSLSDLFGADDMPNQEDYTSQFAGMTDSLDGIYTDTGNISDAMDIAEEDLKYMRDLAEQEVVNRYTVAEVSIDMSGMQNTVNNGDNLDGFMSGLTDAVNEAVDSITEGVHE